MSQDTPPRGEPSRLILTLASSKRSGQEGFEPRPQDPQRHDHPRKMAAQHLQGLMHPCGQRRAQRGQTIEEDLKAARDVP